MSSPDRHPDIETEARAILDLARSRGALQYGEFQLSSGSVSPYYVDLRLVTLDPEGAYRVAKAFLRVLERCGAQAIAGPTIGADPIVAAVAAVSYRSGRPVAGLIVRKETKDHGTRRAIEGPVRSGLRVAVVDDTCSTGANLLHAIDEVEAAACEVVKVMCILDRHQGGSAEIKRRGYDFFALLEADAEGDIRPAPDPEHMATA